MTIDERNQIRAAAQLPLLNVPTEMARLARLEADARFEEYVARRRGEFAHLWSGYKPRILDSRGNVWRGPAKSSIAPPPLNDLLNQHGYRLIEDSWQGQGRRTYIHDDDATREFIAAFANVLRRGGWETHPNELRAFRHRRSGELLEMEPGGASTSGHFLHHLKPD
jgi:hypothetical protein